MYRGFNLSLNEKTFELSLSSGQQMHNKNVALTRTYIDKLYIHNHQLNGSTVIEDWFPNVESNIFISHAHADSKLALQLSGWLKENFNLTSFIDSCVWGHSDVLLKNLNDRYSKDVDKINYSYEKVIRAASHVNVMLSTALTKMINSCEVIIFLNTPSSIIANDYISGSKTSSPWIYSEILMTSLIKKRMPYEHRKYSLDSVTAMESLSKSLAFSYDVTLDHLSSLSLENLKTWKNINNKQGESSLDTLYKLNPIM